MARKMECIAMLLAGGQGSRLGILTKKIAKPAVPYGGKYRIIDFPLSNCVNSGISTVGVLTQYQPLELNDYIGNGQPWELDRLDGGPVRFNRLRRDVRGISQKVLSQTLKRLERDGLGQLHFQRHGAAVGGAAGAQAGAVAAPGFNTVNVNNLDGGAHGGLEKNGRMALGWARQRIVAGGGRRWAVQG